MISVRSLSNLFVILATAFVSASVFATTDFDDLNCKGPLCAEYRIDTDGGDNPESPGCQKQSDNAACTGSSPGLKDFCDGETLGEEIGPAMCTLNGELEYKEYNCNSYCMSAHGQMGNCLTMVVSACNNAYVGYCSCFD